MDISVAEAVKHLQEGAIVALPTETVYGLAAHALNTEALKAIFQIKGRPLTDPLIVHILDSAEAEKLLLHPLSAKAKKLIATFWPGPLTLILPKASHVPDLLTAGRPNIALRSPKHPVFREILRLSRLPLAAPSANPFGYLSPTEASHVKKSLKDAPLPFYIVDGGPCIHGLESTILDLSGPQPILLRPGPISHAALESTLGESILQPSQQASPALPLLAPGTLKQHYSPHTPLYLYPYGGLPESKDNRAQVYFAKPKFIYEHSYWLSEKGSLAEAASNLFKMLHLLDLKHYTAIDIESAPPEGLGISINDRLKRAAAKFS